MAAGETFRLAAQAYQSGDLGGAERYCREILAGQPDHFDALHLLGVLHSQKGDNEEAARWIGEAVRVKPASAAAQANLAQALLKVGRKTEALQAFDAVVSLKPNEPMLYFMRANLLLELKQPEDAVVDLARTVELAPNATEAHDCLGLTLMALGRLKDALESFNRAIALNPQHTQTLLHRVFVLRDLDRLEEALADCNRIIALDCNNVEGYYYRACVLNDLEKLNEALVDCKRALKIQPDFAKANGLSFHIASSFCDWRDRAAQMDCLSCGHLDRHTVNFYPLLYAVDDPKLHFYFAKDMAEASVRSLKRHSCNAHPRLRIAYLSTDFHNHPVAYQSVELLERHSRVDFEIHGFCTNPSPPPGEFRERVKSAFDRFASVGMDSDYDIAKLLVEHDIDIAVDLDGYADGARAEILSWRPSPIAVTYLGHPGTLGADYIDYIIADRQVIPTGSEEYYAEKVVRLPDCFMPIDTRGWLKPAAPSRREAGLPDAGFVFCAFNNVSKFSPELFSVWMRLLDKVPGSVLWLRVENATAEANLCVEAVSRGISADRLIFAPRTETRTENFARLSLADLYLDTFPYGAHATASDFLRMGVPIVTCAGQCFASRVAASMLTVAGLPELIANDFASYEAKALELARNPELLATMRAKAAAAGSSALFDMEKLCRNIEQAYRTMWDRHVKGLSPESFTVGAS